ncbi:hypothetical protein EV356DRAFT_533590 [Viridothelium virens]|uniref:LPXTG-domain-containing protein n=1 Tax=Viridothelium virens TaxID=1048519 RepID=A0A6A6H6K9_VIRVR|nr:hypothetical protein EV356DRAFT_533590 [Viridothelium virens]
MSNLYPLNTGTDGQLTSWIALTTTWRPTNPSLKCRSSYRLDGPSLMAYDPAYGIDIDQTVVCQPPQVTTWWGGPEGPGVLVATGSQHTALSIGPIVCPEDFSTILSTVQEGSSTHAMCCPSDYYLANKPPGSFGGDCLSDVSSGDVLTYASTLEGSSTDWTIVTTTLSQSSTVGAIAVVGWNIGQLAQTPSLTSSALVTTPADFPTVSSTPSVVPSIIASSNTSSSGLSAGAKAGIGVGAALGVLGFLALLGALFVVRRRKHRSTKKDVGAEHPYGFKPELSGEGARRAEMANNYPKREGTQTTSLFELPVEERPLELPTVIGMDNVRKS